MADPKDRREHRRFKVEGSSTAVQEEAFEIESATAQIKTQGLKGALFGFPKTRYRILNISKGGMAFESEKPFKKGEKLAMMLFLPGADEPIELTGVVRWQKNVLSQYVLITVGVQFDSFGDDPGANSPEAYEVLHDLEERFGHLEV